MTPADKPKFVSVLVGLAAIKPGKGLTPEAIEIWWEAMHDWTLEDFKAAATHLTRTIEFMPSPFHFEQLRKAGRSTAGEAWAKVLQIARQGGRESGDVSIDRAVAATGGYEAISMSHIERTAFLERRFAEHYEAMREADDVRGAVPQIARGVDALRGPQPIRQLLARVRK